MWNLFKNVLRSLKKNKASVIGLTFLVFLSMGLFTVLNSTASNISNEYHTVSTKGNIHDFTVSENYQNGNGKWKFGPGSYPENQYMGESSDTKDIPWPYQSGSGSSYQRTYQLALDTSDLNHKTLLWMFYNTYGTNPQSDYYEILNPIITVDSDKALPYLGSTTHEASESYNDCQTDLGTTGDLGKIQSQENDMLIQILNFVTQTHTPIEDYLNSAEDKMKTSVEFRNFQSIDVNNSPDDVYYKVVQSNPEDTIDKEVLFNNGKSGWDGGQTNFSTTDFNPLLDVDNGIYAHIYNHQNVGQVLGYKLPSKDNAQFDDWKKIEAYFRVLNQGDVNMILDETLKTLINTLATTNHTTDPSTYETTYDNYYTDWYNNGSAQITRFINSGYKYTINWQKNAIQAWTMNDWTAQTAIAAPEYLNKHKKIVLPSASFTSQQSYINWKNKPENSSKDVKSSFAGWLNSLKQADRDQWISTISNNYGSSTLSVGGGLPFIIIGNGITADFAYPIVDIQHSTPNPNKECIIFANTSGYQRTFDAFRSNPTENYLVGVFKPGTEHNTVINDINKKAQSVMNWPNGTRAAYLANDTTDFLNASAFRIAYIPSLVAKVKLVDYFLTTFVIILGLFICAIVIRRYITSTRLQIGIMQANGVSKYKIAVSLTPFALIPAIFGGIGGYIIGFLLQAPAIHLFSSYWMLPTPLMHFSLLPFLMSIFVPFLIFFTIAFISCIVLLREGTVDLMKPGSEYKAGAIAKYVKRPITRLGIMTKFRVSVAFNSIWKLLILTIMSSLSMSSLVFGITMANKFEYAKNKTFNSREYKYAVDMYSPTEQGGQYLPITGDDIGQSGYVHTESEGNIWVPNNYYAPGFYGNPSGRNDTNMLDVLYSGSAPTIVPLFGTGDYYCGIPKQYHLMSYEGYDVAHVLTNNRALEQSMIDAPDPQGQIMMTHGAGFYPMISDSTGEKADINFMKNKTMTKSTLDFTVGVPGLMSSNPWSIVVSLMPENNKNLCDGRTTDLINKLGAKCNNPSDPWYTDNHNFFVPQHDSKNVITGYILNNATCIDDAQLLPPPFPHILDIEGVLNPNFISFLNMAYEQFIVNGGSMLDNDYQLTYNKIPLKPGDETYTYISATGDKSGSTFKSKNVPPSGSRIVGIKNDSKYVELLDSGNNNLLPLINSAKCTDPNNYPLIVNAFAAHKYGLKVGDYMAFDINNGTNRIQKKIDQDTSVDKEIFRVAGINTTYQGEEYFTNQELANKILGLRSRLTDFSDLNKTLHNYYPNSEAVPIIPDIGLDPPYGWNAFLGGYHILDVHTQDIHTSILNDLTSTITDNQKIGYNPTLDYINNNKEEDGGAITPYGFNGVFTERSNGSAILNGGFNLYSPSGIYPSDALLNSDQVISVLKISDNLEVANIMSGMYKPQDPTHSTALGQAIHDAFVKWSTASSAEAKSLYTQMQSLAEQFVQTISDPSIFGNTAYTTLVSGALDKDSTNLIFKNLSSTISQIEYTVLVIITVMVIIIVMLIAIMLIGDSKRLAAILKSLGYSDIQNIASFLSIYIPVIVLGLIIAIPLSFGLIAAFQAVIFNGAGILLLGTIKWWHFVVGLSAVVAVLGISGLGGYRSLSRDRLVEAIR